MVSDGQRGGSERFGNVRIPRLSGRVVCLQSPPPSCSQCYPTPQPALALQPTLTSLMVIEHCTRETLTLSTPRHHLPPPNRLRSHLVRGLSPNTASPNSKPSVPITLGPALAWSSGPRSVESMCWFAVCWFVDARDGGETSVCSGTGFGRRRSLGPDSGTDTLSRARLTPKPELPLSRRAANSDSPPPINDTIASFRNNGYLLQPPSHVTAAGHGSDVVCHR
jgi:hypothetical protein